MLNDNIKKKKKLRHAKGNQSKYAIFQYNNLGNEAKWLISL